MQACVQQACVHAALEVGGSPRRSQRRICLHSGPEDVERLHASADERPRHCPRQRCGDCGRPLVLWRLRLRIVRLLLLLLLGSCSLPRHRCVAARACTARVAGAAAVATPLAQRALAAGVGRKDTHSM